MNSVTEYGFQVRSHGRLERWIPSQSVSRLAYLKHSKTFFRDRMSFLRRKVIEGTKKSTDFYISSVFLENSNAQQKWRVLREILKTDVVLHALSLLLMVLHQKTIRNELEIRAVHSELSYVLEQNVHYCKYEIVDKIDIFINVEMIYTQNSWLPELNIIIPLDTKTK